MTRGPGDGEQHPEGGKAAERRRQFLRARFGDEAPSTPADDDEESEGQEGVAETSDDKTRGRRARKL